MSIPIIRIEVQGMRENVQSALAVHNDEFNAMVSVAVEKAFTVEAIQDKLEMQVAEALDNAINGLSEHYQIKNIVKDIVLKSLEKKRDEIEEGK